MSPYDLQNDCKCLCHSLCEVALVKWKIILEIYSFEKGLVSVDLTTLSGASLEDLGKQAHRTVNSGHPHSLQRMTVFSRAQE